MAYKYIEPKEKIYAKAYKVYSGAYTSSLNIKAMYPHLDYTQLTSQDFVAGYLSDGAIIPGYDVSTGGNRMTVDMQVGDLHLYCNYNPSNGILSLSMSNPYAYGGWRTNNWSGLNIQVLMIVDGIRSEYT